MRRSVGLVEEHMERGKMSERPEHRARADAEAFQDRSVVAAYKYRPPYPPAVFDIRAGLITTEPRRVLDVGCGTGDIARNLVGRVDQVDAVDFSLPMIEAGRRLPSGDHPDLRWLHGRVEEVALDPSYALVTAGASLHWMEWGIELPRFHAVLASGGYLAIVEHRTTPDPWSTLGEIIARYRTDTYQEQSESMIDALERQGLFRKVGEVVTASVGFAQSIDDYIESYHSRSGLSRERMGQARAVAFDAEARRFLLASHGDGVVSLQVAGSIVWGVPSGRLRTSAH
jgi:ubiquinone/menaquinone biosynthesis C-methylase UbiE